MLFFWTREEGFLHSFIFSTTHLSPKICGPLSWAGGPKALGMEGGAVQTG